MTGTKPCQVYLVHYGWQRVFQQLHSWAPSAHSYWHLILRKSLGLVPPAPKERLQAGSPSEGKWTRSFPALFSPPPSSGAHRSHLSAPMMLWQTLLLMGLRNFSFQILCLSQVASEDLSWLALLQLCHSLARAHDHFFPCLDTFLWHWDKELTETWIHLPTPPCAPFSGRIHISYYHFSNADFF